MAEGVVERDVGVMAAWLTAGLVAVVRVQMAGKVIEGATEVAARLVET